MKFLTFVLSLISFFSMGQNGIINMLNLDLVNRNPLPGTNPSGPFPQYINNSLQTVYNSELPQITNSYTGEYMILIREHPIYDFRMDHALSYKIEVVSFPFTINCWNSSNSCGSLDPARVLKMPDGYYDNVTHSWGSLPSIQNRLLNIRENGQINLSFGNGLMSGGDGHPEQLVTVGFLKDGFNPGINYSSVLPHTVLKHTVYIHCNTSLFSNKIDSIVWVYDNTRGRMRNYPFKDDNIPAGAHPSWWDVVYVPEIISKPVATHFYNETDNLWLEGGTINYFPLNLFQNSINCNGSPYTPGSETEPFRYFTPPDIYSVNYPCPPPFSLLSSFLRNGNVTTPAGYVSNNGLSIPNNYNGVPHTYFIDNDFDLIQDGVIDLSIINPSAKTIYNPSEVSIDPNGGVINGANPPIEVIFPEFYTFKTILGSYPSHQEVTDASNDPQNGTTNLREVSVPVDAINWPWSTTNSSDYPEVMWDDPATVDINGFYFDERFGYYKIEDKATLTVEKCVKLFDARFSVSAGGTLRFNHYPGILGLEDKDNVRGRYKIRGEGGAILRNFAQTQYVQNGNIFQTIPLIYIASSTIEAGYQVDPDTDQPTGKFEIKTGASVTFKAGEFIHLTDGFSVQGGEFHAYIDENMGSALACNQQESQSGNRNSMNEKFIQSKFIDDVILISPNPNVGKFTLEINDQRKICKIIVYDSIGRQVYKCENLNSNSHLVNLNNFIKGVLIAHVSDENGNINVVKISVQ